jgi:small subunit ribosomal protein S16
MAVHIRLSRAGRKDVPFFRIVVVDSRVKRDGKVLANIGTYDALKGRIVQFHDDICTEWISKGAQFTDSARKIHRLFKKEGIYTAPSVQKNRRAAHSAEEVKKAE